MHRHVLLVSLRCCFIHRCLDKSDCIAKSLIASGTNCIVLHRYVPMKQQGSEASNTCLCITIRFVLLVVSILQYNLICPDSDILHIGALKRLTCLYALRYDLSYWQSSFWNTIWFVQTATVSMHYDTIRPAAENSFSLRYDLSRQLPNLSVKWVNF